MKVHVVIPVRLESVRLFEKPLATIQGKTLIARVVEQCLGANVDSIYVACSSERIVEVLRPYPVKTVLTDPLLPTGTDRVCAALNDLSVKDEDIVINLQGDMPLFPSTMLSELSTLCQDLESDFQMATLVQKMDPCFVSEKQRVKVALSPLKNSPHYRALYFSRNPLAYAIKEGGPLYAQHVGIYAYRYDVLKRIVLCPPSPLEITENLEQLRALEEGISIHARFIEGEILSVDTPEDLALLDQRLTFLGRGHIT